VSGERDRDDVDGPPLVHVREQMVQVSDEHLGIHRYVTVSPDRFLVEGEYSPCTRDRTTRKCK
jgi:hypothetical protein